MHFYISEASQPLFRTWKYLPHSPQNPSFLHENEGIYLCVYKALFLHVENRITVWKNALIHLNLYLFKKFNLRGKKCLRYFSPISLEASFRRLGEYQNVTLCFGLFFFFLISVCTTRVHISYFEAMLSAVSCCLYLLLLWLSFNSF